MVFPASGLAVASLVDVFDTTQLAINLDLATAKCALFTDSVASPNLVSDTSYAVAPWNANEVSGTGYTAGGTVLVGTSYLAGAAGLTTFDATDTAWTTATFSLARGTLIHADYLTPKRIIMAVTFGADYAVTAGTFTIQWAAAGIFTVDWIP